MTIIASYKPSMEIFHTDVCAWCPSACNPQPVMTVWSLRACFAVYLSFLSSWSLGEKKDTPVLQPRCFDQDVLQQWGSDSQGTEKITTPVSADNEHTRTEGRQGGSQHFSQHGEDLYKAPPPIHIHTLSVSIIGAARTAAEMAELV